MTTRGQKPRKTKGKGFWVRSRCVICDAEGAKKHRIGETERQNAEEQKE